MKRKMKERLLAGEVLVGGQLRFGSPAMAELFGHAGFDFLVIDGEHAPQTCVGVQAQLQAIGCTDATALVRLGRTDPDEIRLYLDIGAKGIVVPLIRTAEEARIGAQACLYPPQGTRSYGPARGADYGFDTEHYPRFNEEVLFLPIIETAEAVDNIEEILAVDGVDSFIVGPFDLSIALGVPTQLEHPRMSEAVEKIAEAARKAGKPAGMGVYGDSSNPETFQRFIDMGYSLLLGAMDESMMQDACAKHMGVLAKVRN